MGNKHSNSTNKSYRKYDSSFKSSNDTDNDNINERESCMSYYFNNSDVQAQDNPKESKNKPKPSSVVPIVPVKNNTECKYLNCTFNNSDIQAPTESKNKPKSSSVVPIVPVKNNVGCKYTKCHYQNCNYDTCNQNCDKNKTKTNNQEDTDHLFTDSDSAEPGETERDDLQDWIDAH